ncbi:MAG TPA: hypothetical protein PKH77_11940 [Anaerolineae bacterium]|nr:hypothetical protein [Anaerolineae bacterium]
MSVIWQQRTHGIQRRKQQSAMLLARLFVVAIIIATTMAAAYLALVAANVHAASRVWTMEQTLSEMYRQNHALWIEIARASSIPVLQERSVQLGYQPAHSVDFLQIGEP